MAEKPFLSEYSGETIETLIGMADRYRIDSLIVALEQALDQKAARLGDAALSNAENAVVAIEALEREVNNGGYSQFFFNSSNEYVGRIVSDLELIGCVETARLTARAIAALGWTTINAATVGERVSKDDDALSDALEECDIAYFALSEEHRRESCSRSSKRIKVSLQFPKFPANETGFPAPVSTTRPAFGDLRDRRRF